MSYVSGMPSSYERFSCSATLRLAPVIPTKVAMAQFPNVEKAVSAVQEILNSPAGSHIRM